MIPWWMGQGRPAINLVACCGIEGGSSMQTRPEQPKCVPMKEAPGRAHSVLPYGELQSESLASPAFRSELDVQTYRVVGGRVPEDCVALKDNDGRYHVARALNQPPPTAGTALTGAHPHLGFGVLQCTESGRMFRVIFEAINSESHPTK